MTKQITRRNVLIGLLAFTTMGATGNLGRNLAIANPQSNLENRLAHYTQQGLGILTNTNYINFGVLQKQNIKDLYVDLDVNAKTGKISSPFLNSYIAHVRSFTKTTGYEFRIFPGITINASVAKNPDQFASTIFRENVLNGCINIVNSIDHVVDGWYFDANEMPVEQRKLYAELIQAAKQEFTVAKSMNACLPHIGEEDIHKFKADGWFEIAKILSSGLIQTIDVHSSSEEEYRQILTYQFDRMTQDYLGECKLRMIIPSGKYDSDTIWRKFEKPEIALDSFYQFIAANPNKAKYFDLPIIFATKSMNITQPYYTTIKQYFSVIDPMLKQSRHNMH